MLSRIFHAQGLNARRIKNSARDLYKLPKKIETCVVIETNNWRFKQMESIQIYRTSYQIRGKSSTIIKTIFAGQHSTENTQI